MNPRFPVYQIDFSAVAAGKRVAATKRRIRWRFGFPNLKALEEGRTGTDCRGEEHEIVIIWSVTSGKRQVMMDGREIHYSSTRAGILDHSWSAKGNHIMKVMCHAAPPLSANPGFRQYDLYIDGQSFFTMPKVYELGVAAPSDASRVPGMYDYGNHAAAYASPRSAAPPGPRSQAEEDADLQRAISASLEESRAHLQNKIGDSAPPPTNGRAPTDHISDDDDLLNAGVSSQPPLASPGQFAISDNQSTISYNSAPTYIGPTPGSEIVTAPPANYGAPPPQSTYAPGPPPPAPSYGAPAPLQIGYGGAPTSAPGAPPVQSYGAPPPPAYAPAPAYGQNGSTDASLLPTNPTSSAYGSPMASDQLAVGGHAYDDPFAPKPPSRSDINNDILSAYGNVSSPPGAPGTPAAYGTPTQPLSLENGLAATNTQDENGLSMNALVETAEKEPSNPIDAAMKKLVNIDRIDEPAEEKMKLTMKEKEDDERLKMKNKGKPLPPAAHKMVGSQATLSQIKTVKPDKATKEDIMKAPPQLFHPNAAMAGALVVHGQGPPPLPQQGVGIVHGQQYASGQLYGSQFQQQLQSPPQAPPPNQYPGQPQYGAPQYTAQPAVPAYQYR